MAEPLSAFAAYTGLKARGLGSIEGWLGDQPCIRCVHVGMRSACSNICPALTCFIFGSGASSVVGPDHHLTDLFSLGSAYYTCLRRALGSRAYLDENSRRRPPAGFL